MIRFRALASAAAAAAICLAAVTPAAAEPPVWVVRDADSELILFGSVHVLPPGLTWRPARLDAALKQADDLWFELPVDEASQIETSRLAGQLGFLPPGKSLFDLLPAADAQRLLAAAKDYGIDTALLARMKPWLAEVAVVGAAYTRAGADTTHGVEQTVQEAAPPTAKRAAFETPAEQLRIFDDVPIPDQIASLRDSLDQLKADPETYMGLVNAWMSGDTRKLDREALTPMRRASPLIYRKLVTERNVRWTRTLDARLKGKGRTVVVVGVGHLLGPEGVPARLRALGYSVTGP